MLLIAYNSNPARIAVVRDLTAAEIATHEKLAPVLVEARSRLGLFRMLAANYVQWKDYVGQRISRENADVQRLKDEIDRLLLNYLTCFYTIREHFKQSLRRRARADSSKIARYDDLVDALCTDCWEFGFFLDLRGYVQHVAHCTVVNLEHASDDSMRLTVFARPRELLSRSRQWQRCALATSSAPIDLTKAIDTFHDCTSRRYAGFVAAEFFPELWSAHAFYRDLADEARTADPAASMFFMTEPSPPCGEGQEVRLSINLTCVPTDVFRELGLRVEIRAEPVADANAGGQ